MIDAPPSLSDTTFDALDPATIKKIVLSAADVAVVVDKSGVVREIAFKSSELRDEINDTRDWLGRHWRSAVTVESRPKLDALLQDAQTERPIRWRHLNHPAHRGIDVPISYSAVPIAGDESIILLGRDLRATAALQQRLVEAQQSLERDYQTLRQTEARYRALFETAQDGIAVLDSQSFRPLELNPAARMMLGRDAKRAAARPFQDCFEPDSRAAVAEALANARATFRSGTVRAMLNGIETALSVSALREEDGLFLLVRLAAAHAAGVAGPSDDGAVLPALIGQMPDAMALTDADGDIVSVNTAFRALAGLAPTQPVAGEPLGRWIGHDGVDLGVLIANLRQRGTVKLFASVARSEQGGTTDVEISASVRPDAQPGYAFYIRDVGRRPGGDRGLGRGLTQSADKMSALIGRVPLKELVRESTDAIERLCIESALEMTNNNRASAAEMLGVSRQSLYVKLRRYGFGDSDEDGAA